MEREFGMELLVIVLFALLPTVPFAILGWAFLNRRKRARAGEGVTEGTTPETPFAAISMVGLVITVAAVFFLALTIAARLIA